MLLLCPDGTGSWVCRRPELVPAYYDLDYFFSRFLRFVVGTILPPLLPTVFTVSVGVSDDRLARKNIACTQAESVLVAGKVTRSFFDKTGTLTNQGLDFISVRSNESWAIEDMSSAMCTGMSVCHSLSKSPATGELIGNPVDRAIFSASKAELEESGNVPVVCERSGSKLVVVKRFDFDHRRMTQSVIVKGSDGSL